MTRRLAGGLAGAALALATLIGSAAPALAADSAGMADFRRFCIVTGGQPDKVKAAAIQAGWSPLPDGAMGGGDLTVPVAYMTNEGGNVRMVAVMRGEIQPGMHGQGCIVAVDPSTAQGLQAEAAALAGVAKSPALTTDEAVVWVYTDGPTGRRDLSAMSEDDILKLAMTAPVRAVIYSLTDGPAMVGILDMQPQ